MRKEIEGPGREIRSHFIRESSSSTFSSFLMVAVEALIELEDSRDCVESHELCFAAPITMACNGMLG